MVRWPGRTSCYYCLVRSAAQPAVAATGEADDYISHEYILCLLARFRHEADDVLDLYGGGGAPLGCRPFGR